MKFKTKEAFAEQVWKFANENIEYIYYLKDRWKDERKYEDFQDYIIAIQNILKKYNILPLSISKTFTMEFLYNRTYKVVLKFASNGKYSMTKYNLGKKKAK